MGFVIRFIADMGCSTNKYLSEEFLKNNPFPDAHEININILHKLSLENYSVNRWVRYHTLRAQNNPTIDYAMAIDIDVNTLSEEMNDFTTSEIIRFHQLTFDHVTTSLGAFPLLGMEPGFDREE